MAAGPIGALTRARASRSEREGIVSTRSVAIGLLLIPVNVYWVVAAEVR